MKTKKNLIIMFIFVFTGLLFSQYNYYGKNKVRQTSFPWKYIETDHFRVFYYDSDLKLIKKIAQSAEKDYERMSSFLNIQVKNKIPIIYYKIHTDFEQTNLYPGFLPPGAQAFAEPIAHRVVMQGDMHIDDFFGTLTHEIGHIFEYALLYQNISRSNLDFRPPPGWVMEGFADYITEGWGNFNLLTVRDAVLNDQIPILTKGGQLKIQSGSNRAAYDFGHFVFDFLKGKIGDRGIRNFLTSLRRRSIIKGRQNFSQIFNYQPKQFNFEFKKYARNRFKNFFTKENPEEYSYMIGPEFPFFYSFSHQISPTGELLAVATVNYKTRKIEIILISTKTGKVIKNITPGFTSKYDNISIRFYPSNGSAFTWDQKGEKIAFFVRKELESHLVILDVLSGKTIQQVKLNNIQIPTSPDFHPVNQSIYFTGINDFKSFIYSLDLRTGVLKKITDGLLYIKAFNISPDGERIVFSAKKGDFYKLYLGTIEKPEMAIQITKGDYNDITPAFSNDGNHIYYSSDELNSYNINSIDLKDRMLYRYTDVRTGNFFPLEIPNEKNKLIISTYHKGSFFLYKLDTAEHQENRKIEFDALVKAEKPEIIEPEIEILKHSKYQPFKKLFVKAIPSITLGYSTTGDFLGSTSLHVTDLMGDHNLYFTLGSYYGYVRVYANYLNMKNRLQYYFGLFYTKDPYYYGVNTYDPLSEPYYAQYFTLRKQYGGQLALYYPFNRSYRAQLGFSFFKQEENSDILFFGTEIPFGQFFDGLCFPIEFSLVGETTKFSYYGPNMGHTFKISFKKYLKLGSDFMDAYSVSADLRKYFRISHNTLLAFRFRGYMSWGKNPLLYWTGGNNTIRSTSWRSLSGDRGFYFNAEFRFPLITRLSTVLGNFGPIRGTLFFDLGAFWYKDDPDFRFLKEGEFQLQNGLSSYGFGIQFFLLGIPTHFEWVYKWDFKEKKYYRFNFWIGLDF